MNENEISEQESNSLYSLIRSKSINIRLNILFWLKIVTWVVSLLSMVLVYVAAWTLVNNNLDIAQLLSSLAVKMIILMCIIGLVQCVLLINLGNYHGEFKIAGILLIGITLFECAYRLSTDTKWLAIFPAILQIAYIIFFTEAMGNALETSDIVFTKKWDNLKSLYITSYAGMAISTVFMIIPGISIIAVIFLFAFIIATFVASIWEVVLIRQSAIIIKNNNKTLIEDKEE